MPCIPGRLLSKYAWLRQDETFNNDIVRYILRPRAPGHLSLPARSSCPGRCNRADQHPEWRGLFPHIVGNEQGVTHQGRSVQELRS